VGGIDVVATTEIFQHSQHECQEQQQQQLVVGVFEATSEFQLAATASRLGVDHRVGAQWKPQSDIHHGIGHALHGPHSTEHSKRWE